MAGWFTEPPGQHQQQGTDGSVKRETGDDMKLKPTRALYDYWNRLRGRENAPFRCQIDPADLKVVLPEVFILQADSTSDYRFRIAGTSLCAYFGRELRAENFLEMWTDNEREGIESLLLSVTENAAAAVLGITGSTSDGRTAEFEVLLLPLRLSGHNCTQMIGICTPYKGVYWLGHEPIVSQTIKSLRLIWPDDLPKFDLTEIAHSAKAARPGPLPSAQQRRSQLVVIEGGLADR